MVKDLIGRLVHELEDLVNTTRNIVSMPLEEFLAT